MKPAAGHRMFLALIASLAWPSALLAEQDVTFSTEVNFMVRPSASGIVSKSSEGLSLFLNDIILVTDHPGRATPKSFRVGIAFEDPSIGRWNVSHWSPLVDITSTFDATGTLELKRIGLNIPAANAPLDGRWLIIEIRFEIHGLDGIIASSNAHSRRTIFDGQDF